MLNLNDFGAVIFDMDGLVLDTEITYFRAWQYAARVMGNELTDTFCESLSGLHHKSVEQMLRDKLGNQINLTHFNKLSGQYWQNFVRKQGISVKPGFNEFLALIKQQRLPYCLATNSGAVNALECLSFAGLTDVFSIIVSRDDVKQGKPDPAVFLQAALRLQVDISKCLVLEDSLTGIEAAVKAGAFAVYIPSSAKPNQQALEACHLVASDLLHLVELISESSQVSG